ncbi:Phenylalanine--tRNA ligase alpha subunit,phenylalanyl-tRNA synthetase subunit alpha,Phenylalanyl-tRNA synthetase alpha subunit,phenylalanine--tRNA ligase, alpha subunit,tRNA synthetases class II core domain (F) [Chlamydia serpentis]|uniref:Phenylalanine--tRNA ligase alpha subunit n=1 Tax=Chlamydia serpentis TaxID=1967782 RepID=A0A2R8FCH6_9CHLA|nr:phenylalanine--tRNA ligase subunit alpha [Chlamydia serpentis]SPN74098.1 Phenylalanine--tRNA ligase alpha subunit,phenylalanyl-tRNA synthetase subunit alpha,Phenylalanyl-tRNA synthetase alpha subunit,phenylalanine--tRNA ligase, alpha subunit,tRNA synthetases class II core domain (F) [Chlamydia serpentis]
MKIEEELEVVKQQFHSELGQVASSKALADIKVRYLGKKGIFRCFSEKLKQYPDKARIGALINDCKTYIEGSLQEKSLAILTLEETELFSKEKIDVSLPGDFQYRGGRHILKRILDDIVDVFVRLGFSVREAPNIENEANNFTLLNFTENHPARQMHDTFYLDPKTVLRTHTSNVQARELKKQNPPIKVVAPGLCFRNEDISARSHMLFHQVEAFYIDHNVNFSDLTAILSAFYHSFFQRKVELRFRHSYFPFVEPGIEVDVSCECLDKGCALCKHTGWLEVAGAGMIHPQVLRNGDIDPEIYSGYAVGMGIERLVMLQHGISDIRLFSENDQRFLQQFI